MDPKSKKIYEKIENFLEERKGRERRDKEAASAAASANDERRQSKDRRQTGK